MSQKSHVSLETHQCVVCGCTYDTGTLLLDKRLLDSMEPKTCTGLGMCPEHQKMKDDGYIALVAIDPQKSTFGPNGTLKPDGAYLIGRIAHLRASVWPQLMNAPVPPKGLCYVEAEIIDMLERIPQESDDVSEATKAVVEKLKGDES